METSCIRMKAYLIDLDTIEVNLSKQYYQGISPCFYLRNISTGELTKIEANRQDENEVFHNYYFDKVEVDITKVYQVIDNYGLSEVLQYTKLVQLEDFDELFYYDGKDLGASYQPDKTIFKVWAPTALEVMVCIEKDGYKCSHHLIKHTTGVFEREVYGYYDNCSYVYLVKHHNSYIETTDPYSYSSTANGKESKVINLERFTSSLNREYLPEMQQKTEAIIYETSVRDFTMDPTIQCKNPGKYLGFIESGLKTPKGNPAGFDYLVNLGITHVQLMPIFDFATVDENHPLVMYNWGYDPMQYNVPEGSYCSNPNDGYSRIEECRQMISTLHLHGLRVVMDVVYNHVYDVNANAFERIVPGYFFRKYPDGNLSNGSWCGNDVNTTSLMVRKYILDMSHRWQWLYGVDGYRFDLMGIVDVDTLNQIYSLCAKSDPHFIMYGEGWNMDTALANEKRGMQDNHELMPNISFFNDQFRDKLKGMSSGNLADKGYFAGNMYNSGEVCTYLRNTNRYSRVDQSINYAECHDNAAIFDKFMISNGDEEGSIRKKRQLLLNCACLIGQGVPFLHCGQEFFRTKNGIENTYNTKDAINQIHWRLVDENKEYIDFLKQVIVLRKENSGFRYATKVEVQKNITLEVLHNHLIKYTIKQQNDKYPILVIYINASKEFYPMDLQGHYEILYKDTNIMETVEIQPLSMVILGLSKIEVDA